MSISCMNKYLPLGLPRRGAVGWSLAGSPVHWLEREIKSHEHSLLHEPLASQLPRGLEVMHLSWRVPHKGLGNINILGESCLISGFISCSRQEQK